jgi:hypothetical protein
LIHVNKKANVSLYGFNIMTLIQCQNVRSASGKGLGAGFRFTNISQLQIENLSFHGCGAIHNGSTNLNISQTMDFLASIYIYYSVNVLVRQVRIEDGNGSGLAIINTTGYVEVSHSSFKNNSIKGNTTLSGGRGIYIDFTYCPPGTSTVNTGCENFNRNNKNSTYMLTYNTFEANRAELVMKWHHTPLQYRAQKKIFQEIGLGGGLTIYIRADASGNSVTIKNCKFSTNRAILGGGLLINFHDTPNNNSVSIRNCSFNNNTAERGGGGLDIGFLIFNDHPTSQSVSGNFVLVNECNVTGNIAA